MSYTKAPWKCTTNRGCKKIAGGKPNNAKQAQYRVIATTVGLCDEAADLANARLMAAAPTLLAMVEHFIGYCGCAGEPACDGRANFCQPCAALRTLRQMKLVKKS